ncbi:MAG: M23 family metallopeptidase [Akkermansia sp.]|nr:M23 family metallopeptidase [Akkermansia sp.]
MNIPRLIATVATLCSTVWAQPQDLVYTLPTDNTALYSTGGADYYMYVDRLFEGEKSTPWQAGTYGMVRNPFRPQPGAPIMFSRFHEGVDVKPIYRSGNGEPQDMVRPIAPGQVVHVSTLPGHSNYGRYVVIAHEVPEGTIYSLYAHLASVCCNVGQHVNNQQEIGRLGYSGVGLNKTRAHLHLELALMINSRFAEFYTGENKHGNFNGLNLVGFNPTDALLACRHGNTFSISSYFAKLKEHYRVAVPCVRGMDILRRHPFLYKGSRTERTRPQSLEIAFTAEGVPIGIYPARRHVTQPFIISCRPMPTVQQNCTVNRVKNNSAKAALTISGLRYVNQYIWTGTPDEPSVANTAP